MSLLRNEVLSRFRRPADRNRPKRFLVFGASKARLECIEGTWHVKPCRRTVRRYMNKMDSTPVIRQHFAISIADG